MTNNQNTPSYSPEMINTTPITFDTLWEYNKKVGKITFRTILYIVYNSIMLIYLALILALFILKNQNPPTVTIFIVLLLALGVYMLIFLRIILPRKLKQHPSIGGTYTYSFTEDEMIENFTSETAQSQTRLALNSLFKVTESQNYLYLFTQNNTAYIVLKQGFQTGSEDALKALLRAKLPPEKIKFR